jgi:uncharacterized protein (TIGR03382 family)
MRTTLRAVAACLLAGCGLSDPTPDDQVSTGSLASGLGASTPRGTYVLVEPELGHDDDPRSLAAPGGEPVIIYLNRDGGAFTPGRNDARTNRSSIVQRASVVPPWDIADGDWQGVVTCLQEQFARWNVVVTDVDPGNVPHLESVMAGDPADVGQPSGVGGVSPFALDCSVIDNSIVYTFAELYGRSYRTVCDVAAQEIAHSFGLDHERLCSDPMTYMPSCGRKSFQDEAVPCGENTDRACACGEATQNSVAILTRVLGARLPSDPTDPTDPTDPDEPEEPEEPEDPTDPTDPADPTDPQDPTDPTDPADPADPEGPAAATGDIVGGCAAGGTGGDPALPAVLALAAALVGRRRRSA